MPSPCPALGPHAVLPSQRSWPLHGSAASRSIEQCALAAAPPFTLMATAGLAVARLAVAVAPGARRVWIACGPGNNGGDGLVAARHLQALGWQVAVSLLGDAQTHPADAARALQQAQQAGVTIGMGVPAACAIQSCDLAIDALLGLGQRRAPQGALAEAVRLLNAGPAPVLAVDLPTGLCGDTGAALGGDDGGAGATAGAIADASAGASSGTTVRATHTLALLTLKPGLFTAQGRDHAGRVWLDTLGITTSPDTATAWLAGPESLATALPVRSHGQHKGSFGDVLVLGGASGMAGAAMLAARAALTAGAGRTYLARLDGVCSPDAQRPELMPRSVADALQPALLQRTTVVCGCGGGVAIAAQLPVVLQHAGRLVLDADGLNAVAADNGLRNALRTRAARGQASVLTPHPLEAARLLGCSTTDVQADRLDKAQALAEALQVVVVLKGSGTVLASPGRLPQINPTGNARLGSGGSGDVLAGWLGGLWSQAASADAWVASAAAIWLHGHAADSGCHRLPLRAADLPDAMAASLLW